MAAPSKSSARGTSTSKKEVIRPPVSASVASVGDGFLSFSTKMVDAVYQYRVMISSVVIAIFVVAGANAAWSKYLEKRNLKAAAAVYNITNDLPGTSDPLARIGINLGDAGRSDEELAERNEKYVKAAESLAGVAKEYPRVFSGAIAQLKAAELLGKANKYDEAAAAYEAALARDLDEDLLKFRALNGLAGALREQGNIDEAISREQQIDREMDGVWKELGLLELGSLFEEKKDYASAVQTYERFLKEYPNSGQVADVEVRLAMNRDRGGIKTESMQPAKADEKNGENQE